MSDFEPKIISKVPEYPVGNIKRVYKDALRAFGKYYGKTLRPGFVKKIEFSDKETLLLGGLWRPGSRRVEVFPYGKGESGEFFRDAGGLLAHELGHALYQQLVSDYLGVAMWGLKFRGRGFNVAADEAFANLSRMVYKARGNPEKITRKLARSIAQGDLLLPPERIDIYPPSKDYYRDPAILHMLRQEGSTKFVVALLTGAPSRNFPLLSLAKKGLDRLRGKDLGEVQYCRFREGLQAVGLDVNQLAHDAYEGYKQRVPELVS